MSSSVPAPLKVLVIDDEPLARDGLCASLAEDDDVEVVGQGSGIDAVAMIAKLRPDILFLDIQMPEVDGFALLEMVGADAVPAIIFAA